MEEDTTGTRTKTKHNPTESWLTKKGVQFSTLKTDH